MRKVLTIALAIAAMAAGCTAISWFWTRDAVKQYCIEVRPGVDLDVARNLAAQKDLRFFPSLQSEQNRVVALVTRSGTAGRHVCTVEHDGKQVTQTRMNFHD